MEIRELAPTTENLVNSFVADSIKRNAFLKYFVLLLNQLNRNCSISVDGPWGCGKTFFVKQAKLILDSFNDFIPASEETPDPKMETTINSLFNKTDIKPQLCIYYDAWMNDDDEDPMLSLVYSICQTLKNEYPFDNIEQLLSAGAAILEFFTGKNWKTLIESFRKKDPLDTIQSKKTIEAEIEEFLGTVFIEKGCRMIIFIDELDRCKPTFAVKLLERIKHYFTNENITFVFSTNIHQLQHTIKAFYGSEFDAIGYLDRFFNIQIELPAADLSAFYRTLDFNNSYYTYDMVCDAVIKHFNMSLRTIVHFLQNAQTAEKKKADWNPSYYGPKFNVYLYFFVPVMIALRMVNREAYAAFTNGEDYSHLLEVVRLFGYKLASGQLDLTGYSDGDNTVENAVKEGIIQLYKNVFCPSPDTEKAYIRIKNGLMEICSLLSPYANYDE